MTVKPDEYKLSRYNAIMQRAFSTALEFDKQRLIVSSAALGFMVTRLPEEAVEISCFYCASALLQALWVISCACFIFVVHLVLKMFRIETDFFPLLRDYYEATDPKEVKELEKQKDDMNVELGKLNKKTSNLFVIAIICAILYIVFENNILNMTRFLT